MNVLLVDVDSTIPNLALMKLSRYHKDRGDVVTLIRLNVPYYPARRKNHLIDNGAYDLTLASTIFKGAMTYVRFTRDAGLHTGGTGVDNSNALPAGVDDCAPDYSIYPDNDTAYGFISRGCNRKCYFCGVPEKEGKTHQVETDLRRIIGEFKKVKFMDNNFLQLPNHEAILETIAGMGMRCQFNQGLDFRLLTDSNTKLLSKLDYMGEYVFAFDSWQYRKFYESRLHLINWIKPWRAKFYVYVHPDMALGETVKRIEWLRERKILPYVMRDITCWESSDADFYVDIASYANQPAYVKKISFFDYVQKRYAYANCAPNTDRMLRSSLLYANAMYEPDRQRSAFVVDASVS